MKSKEEIEQLAFKNYGYTLLKGSFIHGYTQCQEDVDWELLVKLSKRYTEEDMLKCWNTAFTDAMNIDSETYKPIFYSDFPFWKAANLT